MGRKVLNVSAPFIRRFRAVSVVCSDRPPDDMLSPFFAKGPESMVCISILPPDYPQKGQRAKDNQKGETM